MGLVPLWDRSSRCCCFGCLQAQEELSQLQFAVQEALPRDRDHKHKRLRAAQEVLDSDVASEVGKLRCTRCPEADHHPCTNEQ